MVSIHARSGWAGRLSTEGFLFPRCRFNPRPVRMGRATAGEVQKSQIDLFQSTPGPDGPGDSLVLCWMNRGSCFNPRPVRMGRATNAKLLVTRMTRVSIHARSGWAGRPLSDYSRYAYLGFNPRPVRMGRATLHRRLPLRLDLVSIHARSGWAGRHSRSTSETFSSIRFNPRPVRMGRATTSGSEEGRLSDGFNPRPVRMGRATRRRRALAVRPQRVSIHARSGWAGRPRPERARPRSTAFQSTPGPDGPGDLQTGTGGLMTRGFNPRPVRMGRATNDRWIQVVQERFQSTPGPDGPGDLPPAWFLARTSEVSIHARSGWAGRLPVFSTITRTHMFQSTPGPDGPGDPSACSPATSTTCFNPRPVRMGRATIVCAERTGTGTGFNPRPVRMGRATLERAALGDEVRFQSTPGPDGPGDLPAGSRARSSKLFQSTPGPDGPGDAARDAIGVPHVVSIHARSGWAGRPCRCCKQHQQYPVSIHARSGWAGRHGLSSLMAGRSVSIHARSGWAGRPDCVAGWPSKSWKFQSTPGPDGPGDPCLARRYCQARCFNPRPVRMGRATEVDAHEFAREPVSIHARSGWAGRLFEQNGSHLRAGFNPRPVRMGRATLNEGEHFGVIPGFNPRPVRMGRATMWAGHLKGPEEFQSTPGPDGPGDAPSENTTDFARLRPTGREG